MKMPYESNASLRIELDGDLWGDHALTLAERLPLSELAGAKCVVLSFEKVRHLDQAGLAMLVRLYSHLRVRGANLQLVNVPASVHALLERVGFSNLVSYADGFDAAMEQHTVALGVRVEA
ncbi:MAG: STAS domain-containing protein [Polyangiales bacterium]